MDNTNDHNLRPICFVIMPYGKKPTMSDKGPVMVDYNALWDKALLPFIESDLGYTAIRADQDLGAMIIKEMLERLALSDLVIAEISTPNTNVYYEVGIRHAASKSGCVLISADWAKQPFDAEQLRQFRYPIAEGDITDDTAQEVRAALNKDDRVKEMIDGLSPMYECLPNYPTTDDLVHATSFRKQVEEISKFAGGIRAIRIIPQNKRKDSIEALILKYKTTITSMPGIAMEIIYLLRDSALWQELVDFFEILPSKQQSIPILRETYALALSKTNNNEKAIGVLQELIKSQGESSERRGLIGGRYKALYREKEKQRKEGDSPDAEQLAYLSSAIAEYTKGMQLDLNDYFPSSNLPRLLRLRQGFGDEEKAKTAATVAYIACERAKVISPSDPWILPTLLGMAFESGNIKSANQLYIQMLETGPQPFQLETTVPDLELALSLSKFPKKTIAELNNILDKIRKMR